VQSNCKSKKKKGIIRTGELREREKRKTFSPLVVRRREMDRIMGEYILKGGKRAGRKVFPASAAWSFRIRYYNETGWRMRHIQSGWEVGGGGQPTKKRARQLLGKKKKNPTARGRRAKKNEKNSRTKQTKESI
jgi:hypothetical protein